ncbi:MAG: response regulator [Elusimicrobia bacterium]|nr:response regulator [Elusimicrobiota bacterium]
MPVTILAVDDEPIVLQLLKDYLEGVGYNVLIAGDGYSAISMFAQGKPRLVILDYNMPAGTGGDVLDRIRGRAEGAMVPVIFLTAASLAEVQMQVPPAPNVRFLNKPVDFAKLEAAIKELLGSAAVSKPAPAAQPAVPAAPPAAFDSVDKDPGAVTVLDLDADDTPPAGKK